MSCNCHRKYEAEFDEMQYQDLISLQLFAGLQGIPIKFGEGTADLIDIHCVKAATALRNSENLLWV